MNESGDVNTDKAKPEETNNVQRPENYGKERVRELPNMQCPKRNLPEQGKSGQDADTGREKTRELEPKPLSETESGKESAPVYHNVLLGEIDENRIYKISDEIAKELILLEKIVTSKDISGYKAYALCGTVRLDFIVSVKDLNGKDELPVKVAYLKLVEGYRKQQQTEKRYILTTIAKFQDVFTNDYLFKVKKAFHLHSKEELEGKVFSENEAIAPLTLSSYNRFALIETNPVDKLNAEFKHIEELLKILRTTQRGREIAEKFVKQTNFKTQEQTGKKYSNHELKEILYKMIDSAIQEKKLDAQTTTKITEAKTKYIVETKKESTPIKSGPASSKPAGKVSTPSKSAPSAGKPKNKGGGDKPKSKNKDKDKKKDKKDKQMIDIIDLLIERSRSAEHQNKTNENANKMKESRIGKSHLQSELLDLMEYDISSVDITYQEVSKSSSQTKLQAQSRQQDQELSR